MKHARRACTALTLGMMVLLVVPPLVSAEWAMEGADPAHTGEQQSGVLSPANQWQVQVDGELMCPPAAAYGRLFIGTSSGHLKVLDEVDGHEIWSLKLGETICATPLVESQMVYVPAGNTIYAVATSNRSVRWSFQAVGDFRGSPVLVGDRVYAASEDKRIYALNKYYGELEWSIKLDDVISASPSVYGNTVIAGTESGKVFGIHRTEGSELWSLDLGSPVSTSACVSKGTAIVGTYGGRLHALDSETGEDLWTFPPKSMPALDPILTAPATSSGLVYFGSDGLYCLEVGSGEEVWRIATGDTVRGSPAVVESYLVFGSYDGLVRCVDKTTGRDIWQFLSDTSFRSSVCIDYDKVFIGGRDGVLYARSVLNNFAPVVNGPYNLETEAHDSVPFEVVAEDPEGNVISYKWDFGDDNTSTDRSPLHQYPVPGEYTVTVTVSDGTKTSKHTITVIVHPFKSTYVGGDEDGTPLGIVAGAAAGALAVVVVALLLWLRTRRRASASEGPDEHSQDQRATSEPVIDRPEPGDGERRRPPPPPPPEEEPLDIVWQER